MGGLLRSLGILGAVILLITLLQADTWTGKAVGITDGDTMRLLKDSREVKIRLHGIDAPEEGQPYGTRAKQYLSNLAFGKDIRAEVLETDKYGRFVALLYLPDGRCLNHELVRHGFAWWYRQYASADTLLARLEKEAQEGGVGLWEDREPIAPWEWRRGKRGPMAGNPAAPRAPPVVPYAMEAPADAGVAVGNGEQGAVGQEVVYRTRTGQKYHRMGCRYLKSVYATTVAEATSMGLGPCSVCGPPVAQGGVVERATVEPLTSPRAGVPEYSGRCMATTKKGTLCKRKAGAGGYCWQHGG